MNAKQIKIRPGLYTMYFATLKQIAEQYGYALAPHGSFERDMDLVLIPWIEKPAELKHVLAEMAEYLTGMRPDIQDSEFTKKPGGRLAYTIDLNRGDKHGEWVRYADEQYYIDISITPFNTDEQIIEDEKKLVNEIIEKIEKLDYVGFDVSHIGRRYYNSAVKDAINLLKKQYPNANRN